jgi:hypothetical protein
VSRHGTPWGKGIRECHLVHRPTVRPADAIRPARSTRPQANLRKTLPCERRRTGANPVPSRSCFRLDDGAISGLKTESGGTCKRSLRLPFLSTVLGFTARPGVYNQAKVACPKRQPSGQVTRSRPQLSVRGGPYSISRNTVDRNLCSQVLAPPTSDDDLSRSRMRLHNFGKRRSRGLRDSLPLFSVPKLAHDDHQGCTSYRACAGSSITAASLSSISFQPSN